MAFEVTVVLIGFPSAPNVLGHDTYKITGVVSGTLFTSTYPLIEALTSSCRSSVPNAKVDALFIGVPFTLQV